MSWLFKQTINKDSWGEFFQSIDAFEPLIKAIFNMHNLEFHRIENLTPGTNAVFRVGDKVIKIFAPVESGFYNDDFEIEIEAQKHANHTQIPAPKLLFQGTVEDKYLFRYIIMEFINGQEAEHKRLSWSKEQKRLFALQLKQITDNLNIAAASRNIPRLSLQDCLKNNRWNNFPNSLLDDRKAWIERVSFDDCTYTHGDLTAENMMIDDDGRVYIIDFADSCIAPHYYEWPPVVFCLFGCDLEMMTAYFGNYHNDNFYEKLTLSLLIHQFGAGIIRQLCELKNVSIDTLADVSCVKSFLISCLQDGNAKIK